MDEQLQQTRQMQAVATLAGGIAHQFNNTLGIISGNLQLIEIGQLDLVEDKKWIGTFKETIQRMTRLTDQLLASPRRQVSTQTIFSQRRDS
jgi:nitrogen-specific signal transduction histidine kinase